MPLTTTEPTSATEADLVSVIVRSTQRPSLAAALASIAAQDHPAVEVVVVGASGPAHPVLPDRCGPLPLRFVACARRMNRPAAANAGLDAATGGWITYLDDDDVLLPGHLSGLMAARSTAPEAGVIHCWARAMFADGNVRRVGQPFNLAQLYERNFMSLSTSVFARSLAERGCRFDEALDIFEDWDMFLQIAQFARFHFVPRETFLWNADAGGSGAGGGANHDGAAFARFRDLVYAKWAARHDALIDHVLPLLRSGADAHRLGDHATAEGHCRDALVVSPNDPWVLNLLASIERATGRGAEARRTQELAVAVRGNDPALVFNLALLCRAQGDIEMARRCCDRALALDANFVPAQKVRAELGA